MDYPIPAQHEKLRTMRHEYRVALSAEPWSIRTMNANAISTLADISGILCEQFPDLGAFTYSVQEPQEGIQILNPGRMSPRHGKTLSEADTEAAATLLCELTDDTETLALMASYAGTIDAESLSMWVPEHGTLNGLDIIAGKATTR